MFLIIVSLLVSTNTVQADELRYSPYSCDFHKVSEDSWVLQSYSQRIYSHVLGWNHVEVIHQSKTWGHTSGEAGFCSYVKSYAPEFVFLTTRQVNGKNIEIEEGGCAFSGTDLKFSDVTVQVSSNDFHQARIYSQTLNDRQETWMHVVGLRPEPILDALNVEKRCHKALKERTMEKILDLSPIRLPVLRLNQMYAGETSVR